MKMTNQTKLQRWFPALITAAALAGTAGLCQAQTILYDFNAGTPSEFYDGLNPAGTEVYTWDATGGPDSSGCLEGTIDGVTTTEIDPAFTLDTPINASQYLQCEFDLKVDPASGTVGGGGSGGNGYFQVAFLDATYDWNAVGYGTLYPPGDTSWKHYTFVIPASLLNLTIAHLQIQITGGAGPYSAPLTIYLDNFQVTALANPFVEDPFISDTSGNYVEENWTGVTEVSSLNPSLDAGGGFSPVGCLEINDELPVAAQWTAWAQSWVEWSIRTDPNRFAYFGFDLYVDPSSTAYSDGNYGALTVSFRDASYANYNCSPGQISIDPSYVGAWKHVQFTLPTTGDGGNPITNSPGYDLEFVGNYQGPVIYYIDNITFSSPVTYPKMEGITQGTPGGVKMTLDTDGSANPNDQEGLSTPQADSNSKDFFWLGQTPQTATYSFYLTNCPAPADAPGFDAHIFVCNGDTLTAVEGDYGYNQTYSGVNWNAGDMVSLDVQNGTAGGVVAQFGWKTNLFNGAEPAGNITTVVYGSMANMDGTWQLNFTDATDGNITAPDGTVTPFTMPPFASDPNYTAINNFAPSTSMIAFGVFKNGNIVNNGQSAIFQNFTTILGGTTVYNDNFNGPGVYANNAWQVGEYYLDGANRTSWSPYGTAFWVEYGLPNTGYSVQSVGDLSGTWGDAGVTYTYADSSGTNYFAAVPTASLPAGNAAFFRLMHP